MPRGGPRPGSGRPKGAANKFSEEARSKAAEEGITPLEYMLAVLRDETIVRQERMDAAKAAAPYMHARLESIKHSGELDSTVLLKNEADAKFGEIAGTLDRAVPMAAVGISGKGELDQESPPVPTNTIQ